MFSDYRPEIDATAELDANYINIFKELIEQLIWDTEIDRVDILHDVSVLSEFQAAPCEGHLNQAFHIFYFMKKNQKQIIYFDQRFPNIDPTSYSGSPGE